MEHRGKLQRGEALTGEAPFFTVWELTVFTIDWRFARLGNPGCPADDEGWSQRQKRRVSTRLRALARQPAAAFSCRPR
jgi:hypothetical protein